MKICIALLVIFFSDCNGNPTTDLGDSGGTILQLAAMSHLVIIATTISINNNNNINNSTFYTFLNKCS